MKILKCYPFLLYPERPVEIIEGFSAYDGNLGDKVGDPHKGIDYVRRDGAGSFQSFDVYSAHNGEAICGSSKSYGFFVLIRKLVGLSPVVYETVYAHLEKIPGFLPQHSVEKILDRSIDGIYIPAGRLLGTVGTSGWTNGIPQMHFELIRTDWSMSIDRRKKIDPYGVNDRFSSGKYTQPGQSLAKLSHFWEDNLPKFAT